MEKLDAFVAGAGAIVLVLAIAGAALSGGVGGTVPYRVDVERTSFLVGDGNEAFFGESRFTGAFTFDLTEANVSALFVNVSVQYLSTGDAGDGSLHVLLEAPDGTQVEGEAAAPPGPQSIALVELVVPLAEAPESGVVDAATAAEAEADVGNASETGRGTWTLTVQFSSGVTPANSGTVAWEATGLQWRAHASPASADAPR